MYKFQFVAVLFSVLAISNNIQTANGGHTYSNSLQINIKNIDSIHERILLNEESTQNGATLCQKGFCCQFKTEPTKKYDSNNATLSGYSLFVYTGPATLSNNLKTNVEICGITKSSNSQQDGTSSIGDIEILGKTTNKNSTVYPFITNYKHENFSLYQNFAETLKYNLIDGSVEFEYDLDDEEFDTFLVFGINMDLENLRQQNSPIVEVNLEETVEFKEDIKVDDENLTDYLYTRLKILGFIIAIYCLEQM